jgi:hypothetical protein
MAVFRKYVNENNDSNEICMNVHDLFTAPKFI